MTGGTVIRGVVFPVTVHAETHIEGFYLFYLDHFCHISMTLRTVYTAIDMTGVIKVDKIRLVMDFNPFNRSVFFMELVQLFHVDIVFSDPQCAMTIHAC